MGRNDLCALFFQLPYPYYMHIPRFIISGLSGGAGKTMVSLGLARAFARRGLRLRAFKKGPDYIDAAWLALASRSPQGNLDPFFTPGNKLRRLFLKGAAGCDIALVEGNRGLFDGLDLEGSCSTAELARILDAPVILVVDCTKMTRTVAAVVNGCSSFEKNLRLGGVILNRTGNERHRAMVRKAVEDFCEIPVLGVLPRLAEPFMIERHMGLAGTDECAETDALLDSLAAYMEEHADVDAIRALAASSPDISETDAREEKTPGQSAPPLELGAAPASPLAGALVEKPRIGYIRDAAFWFYYQENLDALEQAGAGLFPLSLLDPGPWPEIDGLYIGGGLPELHAEALSANIAIKQHVLALARDGLPIYAECGGFIYLAKELIIGDRHYEMAGLFDLAARFHKRPQGLGYVEATVAAQNPYFPEGMPLRGHEFHFSAVAPLRSRAGDAETPPEARCILALSRGKGMRVRNGMQMDGLLLGNVFASYMHVYAPSLPCWAHSFAALAAARAQTRIKKELL